jgi:tetratricopeptide (TPR) repeat protein
MNIISKLNTLESRSEKQRCLAVLMFLTPFAQEYPLPTEILGIVEPEIETVTMDPIFHRGFLALSGINLSKLELIHFECKDIRDENGQFIKFEGGREICLKSDAYFNMRHLVSEKNELLSFQNKIVERDIGINLEFSHWVNLAQRALSVYLRTHSTLDEALKANITALVGVIRYEKVECRLETNPDNQFMANLYSINRFPEQVNGLYEKLRDSLRQKIAKGIDPVDTTYQLALTEKQLQNYSEAIKLLQSSIPQADNWNLGGDERIGDLYLEIAEIYELSGNQAMAISYYNDALEEYVQSRGEIDPKSAIANQCNAWVRRAERATGCARCEAAAKVMDALMPSS